MTSATNLRLSRIGQIAVPVKDLDRAVEFYRAALGMAFLFRVPSMAFFDCAGIRLMLSLPETPEFDHPGSIIYFKVDDIQGAHEALAGRGVAFEGEPHVVARLDAFTVWMAFFRDSERNLLAITSEVPNQT